MSSYTTEISEYGKKIMNTLQPGLADQVISKLGELDDELPKLIVNYAFADVVGRPGLDIKTREMLTVASLITSGNAQPQLELHMRASLNVGVTEKELLEIVIQMAIYAGVPACMNAITAYRNAVTTFNKSKSATEG